MNQVSVVIPCYNLGRYLPETVESVRAQTQLPHELIIVNDGSTDEETLHACRRYAEQGVRVFHTPNRGAPAARNYGIERAGGEFILCLDADDVLMPEYLERTVACLAQSPEAGIVTSHVEFFGNVEGVWKTLDYAPTRLLWQNCIASASLFRKQCWHDVGGYEDLPACQDWNFWISIAERGWKWKVVPVPLYRYRVRSNSISEHGRANRRELLRRLVELHPETYRANLAEILYEVDGELARLRGTISNYARDSQAQARKIKALQQSLVALQAPAPPVPAPAPAKMQPHFNTFSVVICTYRRAEFLGKAIESVFAQDYPKDKYEIIVINNDSPDHTEQVAQECARRSPVPFACYRERQNGLSYARNLGIAKSQFEFVAHLDDDATASTNWLRSFNDVINEHHALVVGGRVEKVFEEGFQPPQWFQYQYLQGFFGLNYREWGKREKVFRIRYPKYIGGGNSVYAKRLYQHFGNYDPRLGRDGKTLLAGEETFLNMTLDRHDIPIFYSDDAVIYHFIESWRVTKSHLKKKAYWSGVTNAILYTLFFPPHEARQKLRGCFQELKRLMRKAATSLGDLENFSRRCRIIYLLSFLFRFHWTRLKQRCGSRRYVPEPVHWNPEAWVAELDQRPESPEKYQALRHFYLAMGNVERAREADAKLNHFASELPGQLPGVDFAAAASVYTHLRYQRLVQSLGDLVDQMIPRGGELIVVSKGDDQMLDFPGHRAHHFPQNERGEFAGHYPADCREAIDNLERVRAKGGEFLVFPETAEWWLDHYREFRRYLETQYGPAVHYEGICTVFDVRQPAIPPLDTAARPRNLSRVAH